MGLRDDPDIPTVLNVLHWTQDALLAAGQEEAYRKAKLILSYVVGCEPNELVNSWYRRLDQTWLNVIQGFYERLLAGEPLQYILGQAGFMGLDFVVTPAVLIPRPDSEIAVEKGIDLLRRTPEPQRIADIGTGSGALVLSLLHSLPQAEGYAVDISPEALDVAGHNACHLQLDERCTFLQGDLCAPLRELGLQFDLIISNPPYVTAQEMAELPPEVQREPALALAGGEDGLDLYRRLAVEALPLVKAGGWLVLEHGYQQQEALCALLEAAGWQVGARLKDYGQRPRVVVAQAAE